MFVRTLSAFLILCSYQSAAFYFPSTSLGRCRGVKNARVCSAARPSWTMQMKSLDDMLLPGPRPFGPDPFRLVHGDMQLIKAKIKRLVDDAMSSSKNMMKNAPAKGGIGGLASNWKEIFERPEKSWRPAVIILLFQAISKTMSEERAKSARVEALTMAEIVEMMNLATQIHDTILEDGDDLEKGNQAHKIYGSTTAGNKVSILAGDFLLSRASVLSASLKNVAIVEAVAFALQSLMEGQVQLHRPTSDQPSLNLYIKSTRRRGGMLLAKGCESVALLAGYKQGDELTEAAKEYGLNLGIAYQILQDLKVTEHNYGKALQKVQKERAQSGSVNYLPRELNVPLQTAGPLLYAAVLFPELHDLAKRGFQNVSEIIHARSLIDRCDAINGMRRMANYHATLALEALEQFPASEAKDALKVVVHYALEQEQPRLMRANYSPDGSFTRTSASSASAHAVLERSESVAKQELYGALDKLYGRARYGVNLVKDSLVWGVMGLRNRASNDINRLHRVAIRDAVLLYGKGVDVPSVVKFVNEQCAFKVSALEVERMLHEEIQWQLRNGIETAEDIDILAGKGVSVPEWPGEEKMA
mmetsp:Transcript_31955/g.71768  ORF Transcript_31955/g.71768 Transcript_31955/m.71768 type:complete len:586 (-) Transcript_31955:2388-4145(-)